MKMTRPALHAPTVSSVLGRLWRRRLMILCLVTICVTGALIVDALMPQRYTSTATLTVAPLTDTPYGNAQLTQLVNMESERATVGSLAVSEAASRSLDPRPDPRDVQDSLEVVIPPQSLVLRISATTDDRGRSADWANAVARAYLNDRTASARDAGARIAARLQSDIDALLRTRPTLSAPEKAMVDREVVGLRDRANQLSVVGLVPGRVVTAATPARSPSTISTRGVLGGAVAAGLLLGALLAMLQDRRDPRIGSAAWIQETLGIPARSVRDEPLDRQAQRVLGVLLGRGTQQARLLAVTTERVADPTFAGRLTELAQRWGVTVRHDRHGASTGDEPGGSGDGPSSTAGGDPARASGAVDLVVTECFATSDRPWPLPVTARGSMVVVEVVPTDPRRDLADFSDAMRYLGLDVDLAVVREDDGHRSIGDRLARGHR